MKKLVLVDDDELVLRMYQDALAQKGFVVEVATNGLEALKLMRQARPDVVVLDLLMPKFTGADVLRYMRSDGQLASVPVIVLSNSYMDDLAQQAVKLGVQKALLKIRCSPPLLAGILNDVLAAKSTSEDPSILLAVPAPKPESSPAPAGPSAPAPASASDVHAQDPADTKFHTKARQDFLASANRIPGEIHALWHGLSAARDDVERDQRVQALYRKIHFLTAAAGLAGCHDLALMASAFEALLFEKMDKPARLTPSVSRTMAFTVDFLGHLFKHARETAVEQPLEAHVLVVDDDPLSNRMAAAALLRAQFKSRTTPKPREALQWAREIHFDLVLLDIEMPEMDGFELCKALRTLPGYARTPIIYLTSHSTFDSRAKSVLSGGNDLLAKPVLPLELTVKVVTHLLNSRLTDPSKPPPQNEQAQA